LVSNRKALLEVFDTQTMEDALTEISMDVPPPQGDMQTLIRTLLKGVAPNATEVQCDGCQHQSPLNLLAVTESPFALCERFVPGAQGGCVSYLPRSKNT
jgi:hypothetical protein